MYTNYIQINIENEFKGLPLLHGKTKIAQVTKMYFPLVIYRLSILFAIVVQLKYLRYECDLTRYGYFL